ncbi:hypothetical protein IWZ00DRAFT_548258 [Phyllosticta capitalensis]|uniref:uncharacterized protein n=1 Tax=Phyllosticta capitalensis TaxID=121624 RepID=UPI00312D7FD6
MSMAWRVAYPMPWVFRQNNVPHYQRLFQKHDGLRQWQKTPRSKFFLYPYYVMLWGSFGAAMYMSCRVVLGKKTWWG